MLVKREVINNRYQTHDLLGEGGMGMVYRATDMESDQDVAIKLLSLPPGESQLRFKREFRVMSRLSHPNVIEVLESGTHDEVPFLVMKLLSGGTFKSEFAGGATSQDDVATRLGLLAQVADALAYVHGEGIIHRDLKPDNIMLEPHNDGTQRAILMDFGLAKTENEETQMLTQPGAVMGTASYMSPEQVRGTEVDARSDLYAFGCLIVWMMTGEPPFKGQSFIDTLTKQTNEPAQPPSLDNPALPEALDAIVLKLLKKDPIERYSIASDVAKALRDIRQTITGEDDADIKTTTSVTPMRLFETPLIGRDDVWQQTQRALSNLPYGGKLLKVASSASGLGLSRFLREVRREARVSDYQVLQVSYRDGAGMPYQAWRDGLSRFEERYPDALHSARQGLEPVLSLLMPDLSVDAPPAEVPADVAQIRLYDAVDKLLSRLVQDKPLVVIIDNAHFADEGSLGLMGYLARGLEDAPLFLAYGYHEARLGKTAKKTLRDLEGIDITLKPLSDAATSELLAALLGGELEPRLERYLLERVAGNPFFAEEVLLAMLRNGALTRQAGAWEWQGGATIMTSESLIPEQIEDVFMQRLERLGESAQKALRVASAIGRTFHFETLQQLLGTDEDTLLDDIDELLRAELIEERSADLYRFSHLLLRETLHDALSARRRRRYHQKIADMLRSQPDFPPGELAEHYAETAKPERAAPFALRAARSAKAVYTNDVAERFYRLYLAVAPDDEAERPQARLELATVLERIGAWDEAEALLHDLSPDPDYQVAALSRLGLLMQKRGELAQSETYLREAIAAEPNSPRLYSQLGRTLAQKGELEEARDVLNLAQVFATQMAASDATSGGASGGASGGTSDQEGSVLADVYIELAELEDHADQYKAAIEMLEKAQEHVADNQKIVQARIFHLLGSAHQRLGDLDLAKQHGESAQELYQEVGDVERIASIKQNIANAFANMGEKLKAIEMSKDVQKQARRLGNKKLEAIAATNLGVELYNLGRYEEAVVPLQKANDTFQTLEMRFPEMHTGLQLASTYTRMQRFTDAQDMLHTLEEQLQEASQDFYEALWAYYQGELFLYLGQARAAKEVLTEAMQAFLDLSTWEGILDSRQALAMACLLLDEKEQCEEQLDALETLSEELDNTDGGLIAAYLRGLLNEDRDTTHELRHKLIDAGLEHIIATFDAILTANDRTPPD